MDNSLQAVNLRGATRNKQRETPCRPIALSDCRSFPSDGSPSRLVYRSDLCRHRASLPDSRPSLGDASTRLPDDFSCLCRRSTGLLDDGPGLLDDSTAVWNHSPRLRNRCKSLKTSILAENCRNLLVGRVTPCAPSILPIHAPAVRGLTALPFAWFAYFAVHSLSETQN